MEIMNTTTIAAYDEHAERYTRKSSTSDFWYTSYNWMTSNMPPGARIIEVGTGSGRDARLFIEGGFGYTGVEPAHGLAELARERLGIDVVEADVRSLDLTDVSPDGGTFDGLWCVAVIMHLSRDETPNALRGLRFLVGDGAPAVIAIKDKGNRPDGWEVTPEIPAPRWYTWWSHEDFGEELEAAGFIVEEFHHRPGWHVFHCHATIEE